MVYQSKSFILTLIQYLILNPNQNNPIQHGQERDQFF